MLRVQLVALKYHSLKIFKKNLVVKAKKSLRYRKTE